MRVATQYYVFIWHLWNRLLLSTCSEKCLTLSEKCAYGKRTFLIFHICTPKTFTDLLITERAGYRTGNYEEKSQFNWVFVNQFVHTAVRELFMRNCCSILRACTRYFEEMSAAYWRYATCRHRWTTQSFRARFLATRPSVNSLSRVIILFNSTMMIVRYSCVLYPTFTFGMKWGLSWSSSYFIYLFVTSYVGWRFSVVVRRWFWSQVVNEVALQYIELR